VLACRLAPLIAENEQLGQKLLVIEAKASVDAQTISDLQARLEELRKNPPVQNVHHVQMQNVQMQNVQNININMITYGNEPPPSREDVMRILQDAPTESIPRFLQLKHFNDASTANLRINKRRPGILERYETDRVTRSNAWVKRGKREALEDLIERTREELVGNFHADRVPRWQRWDKFITGEHKDDAGRKKKQKIARKELAVRVEGVLVS